MLAAGYVVLFPDSLGSRGLTEICTAKFGERAVTAAGRRGDALAALQWLAAQPGIARERIALLGWSHGGTTTLATINANDAMVRAFRDQPDAPPFFRAAVAFYPGCSVAARDEGWRLASPVRILIGDADDWTPRRPARRSRRAPASTAGRSRPSSIPGPTTASTRRRDASGCASTFPMASRRARACTWGRIPPRAWTRTGASTPSCASSSGDSGTGHDLGPVNHRLERVVT